MSKIINNASTAGSQIGNSILGVFGNKEAAAKAAASVEQAAMKEKGLLGKLAAGVGKAVGGVFSGVAWLPKKAFQAGVYVVGRPFVWADALGGKAIGGVGSFFAKNPKTALAGTAIAAGLGVGHVMNKRSEREAQNNIDQLEIAQMRASQAQSQAYTVTPAEYAAMESRMRQGGQNGGFAASIEANRAAAASAMGGPAT